MISLTFPSSKAETNSLQFDTSRLSSEVARRVRVERRASAGAGALSVDLSFFSATSALPSVVFAVSSLDSLVDTSDFSDFGLSVAPFSESEETSVVSGITTSLSATVDFKWLYNICSG